jgi:hypothetical protein
MNDTITNLDGPATVRAYRGEDYTPVKPQPDNEALIDQGERVMLYHQRTGPGRMCKAVLRIAPKGRMCTGFAIGILLEAQNQGGAL